VFWLLCCSLAPTTADLQAASVSHDLRQWRQELQQRRPTPSRLPALNPSDEERLLIRMPICVPPTHTHQRPGQSEEQGVECLEVSVMSTPAEAQGWTWGVDALLAVLDSRQEDEESQEQVSPAEEELLRRGEVVATRDVALGKIVLRTRPLFTGGGKGAGGGVEEAKGLLAHVLQRGLREADRLGAVGLAIVPPDTVWNFTGAGRGGGGLSAQQVQSLTVSCVVDFVRTHALHTLRRIVLLDVLRDDSSASASSLSSIGSGGSLMAEALCRALISTAPAQASRPAPAVVKCNDKGCRRLLDSSGTQPSAAHQGGQGMGAGQKGVHVVVMKGTQECLNRALEEIKDTIATV
jgi:hypothetical protein